MDALLPLLAKIATALLLVLCIGLVSFLILWGIYLVIDALREAIEDRRRRR